MSFAEVMSGIMDRLPKTPEAPPVHWWMEDPFPDPSQLEMSEDFVPLSDEEAE